MEFISSVDQDISRASEANEWDILFNTRNKFHISKHPCILFCLFHKFLNWELIFNLDCWNDIFTLCVEIRFFSVAKSSVSHWCLWNKYLYHIYYKEGVSPRDIYKSSRGLRGQLISNECYCLLYVMLLVCNAVIDEEITYN